LAVSSRNDVDSALSLGGIRDTEDRPTIRGKVGYDAGLDVALPSPVLLAMALSCRSRWNDSRRHITNHPVDDPTIGVVSLNEPLAGERPAGLVDVLVTLAKHGRKVRVCHACGASA
jgi:hypothetical protein